MEGTRTDGREEEEMQMKVRTKKMKMKMEMEMGIPKSHTYEIYNTPIHNTEYSIQMGMGVGREVFINGVYLTILDKQYGNRCRDPKQSAPENQSSSTTTKNRHSGCLFQNTRCESFDHLLPNQSRTPLSYPGTARPNTCQRGNPPDSTQCICSPNP